MKTSMSSGMNIVTICLTTFCLAGNSSLLAQTSPHGETADSIGCTQCHSSSAWSPLRTDISFSHREIPGYQLTGSHRAASCRSCHISLRFAELEGETDSCADCHVDVHRGNTVAECASCHTTTSFADVQGTILHAQTNFQLTGAHQLTTCESCHTSDAEGSFTPLDTDCVSCHDTQYVRTTSPSHVGVGIGTNCVDCHSTLAWGGGNFDHAATTGFLLSGKHDLLRCDQCHIVPGFSAVFSAGGSNDCVACHRPDYDAQHASTGFPLTCADCHNDNSWAGATIDHASVANGFRLLGAHAPLPCASCHIQPGNSLISTPAGEEDCIACHRVDYDTEHAADGFPVTCSDCHTSDTWTGATVDHAAVANGYSLVGAHAPLPCTACHTQPGNQTIFTPANQSDCITCHQPHYDRQHATDGFPVTCTDCHTNDTWTGATVDHAAVANGYSLVGAHAPLPCTACHTQPGNQTIFSPADQNDCVACHQPDYDRQHATDGFPLTCSDCHTTDTWTGAVFDHDGPYFPIYSGAHKDEWTTCAECHTTPGDLSRFSCLECHLRSETDNKHREERDYVYQSDACFSCHPRGNS